MWAKQTTMDFKALGTRWTGNSGEMAEKKPSREGFGDLAVDGWMERINRG